MTSSNTFKRMRYFLAILLVLAVVAVPLYSALTAPSDHGEIPPNGIVCTTNPTASFTLTARDGHISMTDGNTVYMWSFAEGQDDFQHPGPVLCVNEGDTVTVVLHNTLPEDVSLVFPGQENVLANGVPSQPVFDGPGGALSSMAPVASASGGSMTYSFIASKPGTYLYESGTNPGLQVQMGLFGTLIVRPALGADYAYNAANTIFNPETEVLMMLSEIDPILHQAVERGQIFDMSDYHARYFLINGRTFPDTIAPNGASWLPNQPYGSLAHIHPYDNNPTLSDNVTPNPAYNPLPTLTRYVGVGYSDYPFHPHAYNGLVIARDGNLLEGPSGNDLAFESFSNVIGPGQTWDITFTWTDTSGYDPNDPNKLLPVTIPGDQNLTIGPFYSGSGYLGNQDVLPVGTTTYNQCGEFYHIAHNHALQQLVGWGVVMTGQTTFTRIDPPLPNNCPLD